MEILKKDSRIEEEVDGSEEGMRENGKSGI
jgi:hypothetical protein